MCDSCEALMINGVHCHETGCPNTTTSEKCGHCCEPIKRSERWRNTDTEWTGVYFCSQYCADNDMIDNA